MIFEHNIPELGSQAHVFPGQWVNALMSTPQCSSPAGQAILNTYVRFVEAAASQYRTGRALAIPFIERAGGGPNLYNFSEASSAFEACVVYMHRAIRCMRAIRSRVETADVSHALFPRRPAFMVGSVQNRIANVRDAVQHSFEQVLAGEINQGTSYLLVLAGPVRPTPLPDDPDQTTKCWDRVEIGDRHLTFEELITWLEPMGSAAEAITAY